MCELFLNKSHTKNKIILKFHKIYYMTDLSWWQRVERSTEQPRANSPLFWPLPFWSFQVGRRFKCPVTKSRTGCLATHLSTQMLTIRGRRAIGRVFLAHATEHPLALSELRLTLGSNSLGGSPRWAHALRTRRAPRTTIVPHHTIMLTAIISLSGAIFTKFNISAILEFFKWH